MSQPILIESRLFDAAGLTEDHADREGLRVARRLLALAWLLAGGLAGMPALAPCRASVEFWAQHKAELRSWRPATLTTILFQLEAMGVIESFAAADTGFHVQLKEG